MKSLILKINNIEKNIFYIAICLLFTISCSGEKTQITVTEYIKVENNYQYSEFIYFDSFKYKPIIRCVYINDSIESFSTFKSEGELHYEKTEFINDTLLIKTLNIEEVRKIKQDNSLIIDNNKVLNIIEQKKDSLFCISGEKLFVYQLNCNKY